MFAESKGGSGNDFDLSKLQKLLKVKQKLKKLLKVRRNYQKYVFNSDFCLVKDCFCLFS